MIEQNVSLFRVFLDNFLSFDFLIFILAVLNVFFFLRLKVEIGSLRKILYPSASLSSGKESYEALGEHYLSHLDVKGEEMLIEKRSRMNMFYSLYENITQIFPLMGLLGTVISLIPMVSELSSLNPSLFFSALTSTFWGIVFAIIFKALGGISGAKVEDLEKDVSLFLERRTALLLELTRKNP